MAACTTFSKVASFFYGMSSLQEKNIFGQQKLKIQRKFKEMNLLELEMKGLLNFNEDSLKVQQKSSNFNAGGSSTDLPGQFLETHIKKKFVYNLNLSSL